MTATEGRPPTEGAKRDHDHGVVVVGGGFYGARMALMLAARGERVLLVEQEQTLMAKASLVNQARVHQGYHYPRSILTSLRSRRNYARFVDEYRECVVDSFAHYYAIARQSKVSGTQFVEFCRRIGAPIAPAPDHVRRLFDATRIEAVFLVEECAFDADRLRERTTKQLRGRGVEVALGTEATHAAPRNGGAVVALTSAGARREVSARLVINATYSGVNAFLAASGADQVPLKHELTEMALVEPPPELEGAAVTVMDGAFFSLMPYPAKGLFTLSHVRYTPHGSREDGVIGDQRSAVPDLQNADRMSRFQHMMLDAARYLPAMRNARYVDSLWEIKTVLPRSEQDDSRPILLRRSEQIPALVTVLGSKIDSVYDVEEQFETIDGRR